MSLAELSCLTHLLRLAAKPFLRTLKCLNLNSATPPSNPSPNNKATRRRRKRRNNNKRTVQIPLELQSEILSRLPTKQVTRYQCVCKAWRDEISSTHFINTHTLNKSDNTNSYILLYSFFGLLQCFVLDFSSPQAPVKKLIPLPRVPKDYYHVVGSCNGLICLRDREIIKFMICNVATGSLRLTSRLLLEHTHGHDFVIGFGYDSATDDYKILCVVYHNTRFAESCVYSFKTNSWKSIQTNDYNEFNIFSRNYSEYMIFSNNALHWIHPLRTRITCFDLRTEKYYEIVLPPDSDLCLPYIKLVSLRGCLHLVTYDWPDDRDCYQMEIWVMTDYRIQWTKLIRINVNLQRFDVSPSFYRYSPPLPYAYSEDGKEILIGLGNPINSFISCELHRGRRKEFKVPDMRHNKFTAMPFDCFSLFSPKSI